MITCQYQATLFNLLQLSKVYYRCIFFLCCYEILIAILKPYLKEYQPHIVFVLRKRVNVDKMVGYIHKNTHHYDRKYFDQLYFSTDTNQTFFLIGH